MLINHVVQMDTILNYSDVSSSSELSVPLLYIMNASLNLKQLRQIPKERKQANISAKYKRRQ